MKDNTVNIGDLGVARILRNTIDQASTYVGTPYYMAPEIYEGQQYT
jgi:NIMA (never in mitosis gene a)-related kinase